MKQVMKPVESHLLRDNSITYTTYSRTHFFHKRGYLKFIYNF